MRAYWKDIGYMPGQIGSIPAPGRAYISLKDFKEAVG